MNYGISARRALDTKQITSQLSGSKLGALRSFFVTRSTRDETFDANYRGRTSRHCRAGTENRRVDLFFFSFFCLLLPNTQHMYEHPMAKACAGLDTVVPHLTGVKGFRANRHLCNCCTFLPPRSTYTFRNVSIFYPDSSSPARRLHPSKTKTSLAFLFSSVLGLQCSRTPLSHPRSTAANGEEGVCTDALRFVSDSSSKANK